MVHVPLSRLLIQGIVASCLCINILLGEVIRTIHKDHNLGIADRLEQLQPSSEHQDQNSNIYDTNVITQTHETQLDSNLNSENGMHPEFTQNIQQDESSNLADSQSLSYINRVITYADDLWTCSNSREKLALILSSFVKYIAYLGLTLNGSKS